METLPTHFSISEFFWLSLLLLPIFGYAEIHYRLPFLRGLLYQKDPEIVFDLPLRARMQTPVPLFLFVKDAHQFPVMLHRVEVRIEPPDGQEPAFYHENVKTEIKERFFAHTIWLPQEFFTREGEYRVIARLHYRNSRGKSRALIQDNYRRLPHPPFRIYLSPEALPKTKGWYWGDLHLHSNYTDDQVEFGAPIRETARAARTLGLDFIAITDHSYDLDDCPEDYRKNDHQLGKWKNFLREVKNVQKEFSDIRIIPGEEVSVGNGEGRNVHCLILNDPLFHPGKGDGAEKLLHNRPTLSLPRLLERKSPEALAIAAHPTVRPPLSQRLILRRGFWKEPDCQHSALNALQILNRANDPAFAEGLALWKTLLLQGRKIGIVAGNDAHGNFNCYRQIRIPLLRMIYRRQHLLGQARTAVRADSPENENIMKALRQHRAIISTGPFAIFYLEGTRRVQIGENAGDTQPRKIGIKAKSLNEYGSWKEINLYFGRIEEQREEKVAVLIPENQFKLALTLDYPPISADYVRMEAFSASDKEDFVCFTNPIWLT